MTNRDPLKRNPFPTADDLDSTTSRTSIDPKIPQHTDDPTGTGAWESSSGAPFPPETDDTTTSSSMGTAKDDVKGKAQEKASDAANKAKNATDDFANKADSMKGQAQEKAGQATDAAQDKADQGMDAASSGLGQAADMLRDQGEQRGGGVGTAASKTADTLEGASQYLRDKDSGQLMDDLEAFVREKPIESVAIAAGIGFVLSKVFR